jgi:hypothetical protein
MVKGPNFGEYTSQTKTIKLAGHTVQKFEIVEEYNLIFCACFSDGDKDET